MFNVRKRFDGGVRLIPGGKSSLMERPVGNFNARFVWTGQCKIVS